ncbi:MAG: FUSC family protein [Intrasporangium sp.]|uniref:FUSC family protein n=1 Tax=Intrasporangium sp. TaxID=1925024 RepID=UPI003F7EADDA
MPAHVDTPPPFDHRRLLMGAPAPSRLQVAVTAGLSLGIAAAIATVVGNPSHALFVSLGAFTALYGTDRPYRRRAWLLTIVLLMLVGGAFFGALTENLARHFGAVTGTVTAAGLVVVAGVTLLATLMTFLANALQLGPPGGFFFAMVASMASLLSARQIPVGEIAGLTLLGGGTAIVISLLPWLWAPHGPVAKRLRAADAAVGRHLEAVDAGLATSRTRTEAAVALHAAWNAIDEAGLRDSATSRALLGMHERFSRTLNPDAAKQPNTAAGSTALDDRRLAEDIPLGPPHLGYLLRRSLALGSFPTILALRVLVACAVAGTAAYLLGTGRPDWAMMSAILVLHSGVDRLVGTYRALHRLIGTVAGLVVFTLLYAAHPHDYVLIALLAVLQFTIELFVVRNYAVAVALITPLVLLVTTGPGQDAGGLMWARFLDTLIGVGVGVVVLWTVGRSFWRRALPGQLGRVETATAELEHVLSTEEAGPEPALEARRDLQFELIEAVRVADAAYRNAPQHAGRHWQRHLDTQDAGYRLLAACWSGAAR